MKQIKFVILAAVFFLMIISPTAYANPDIVEGKSGILIDLKTGKTLWDKNINDKRAPASITKILTAVVALDNGNLNDIVKVSSNATAVNGTKVWLRTGEEVKLEDLLYAMLVNSANDASIAIAEHIGGSIEGFAGMMNKKAEDLGAKNSNFINPHGLDQNGHYTTAYDISLIAKEAMKNEKFREIVQTKKRKWEGIDWNSYLNNQNNLIFQYEGANGIKSGFTSGAGNCLVASAQRNGEEFLSVLLDCDSKEGVYEETMQLLDYGFENFKHVYLVKEGQVVTDIKINGKDVPIYAEEDVEILAEKEKFVIPKWEVNIKRSSAVIEKNENIGTLQFKVDNKELAKVNLLAGIEIKERATWKDWYFRITASIIILIILFFFLNIFRKRRKNRFMYGNKKSSFIDYGAIKRF